MNFRIYKDKASFILVLTAAIIHISGIVYILYLNPPTIDGIINVLHGYRLSYTTYIIYWSLFFLIGTFWIWDITTHEKYNIEQKDEHNMRKTFAISFSIALAYFMLSVYLSYQWFFDVAIFAGWTYSIFIIFGIALVPGYLTCFTFVTNIIYYKQNDTKSFSDAVTVVDTLTVLIAAYNEESTIYKTIKSISDSVYAGKIRVIIVDNNSKDRTKEEIFRAIQELSSDERHVEYLFEKKQGKSYALNWGLEKVDTKYLLTIDADTYVDNKAIFHIVSKIKKKKNIGCVAGNLIVQNPNKNLLTKIQNYDYLLSIFSIKRMQSMYNSTLVAQGAFSIYLTDLVKGIGGWKHILGEDIVLTWEILEKGFISSYEQNAVGYTVVPEDFRHFFTQRCRWARGMIEGFKYVFPILRQRGFARVIASQNILIPFLDISFIFGFMFGVILAFFGNYVLVGILVFLMLPLTMLQYYFYYDLQRRMDSKIENNALGFVLFMLGYQFIYSPISLSGYIKELLKSKKIWD